MKKITVEEYLNWLDITYPGTTRGRGNPQAVANKLAEPVVGVTGKLYPSGRFGVSSASSKLHKPKTRKVIYGKEKVSSVPSQDEVLDNAAPGCECSSLPCLCGMGERGLSELGLSRATISDTPSKRAKRGSRGIGARQSDIIRWGVGNLESRYGKECLSFLTLTIPPLSPGDLKKVQDNWSEIVDRFVKKLRLMLSRLGLPDEIVGCIEIQEKRYERTGDVYPHIHLVFVGRSYSRAGWAIRPTEFREKFVAALVSATGIENFPDSAIENVQRVKHSAARYLSKYLSKSSSKRRRGGGDVGGGVGGSWHPSCWGIVSRGVRRAYAVLTLSGHSVGNFLLDTIFREDLKIWKQPVTIPSSVGETVIGWFGYLPGYSLDMYQSDGGLYG